MKYQDNVGAKLYYDKKTGDIIYITAEMSCGRNATIEEDIEFYELDGMCNADDIGVKQLEYGKFMDVIVNVKSRKINIETGELELEYYTLDEIKDMEEKEESEAEKRISMLESDNADLLLDSLEKDMRIEQLESDIADILLTLI